MPKTLRRRTLSRPSVADRLAAGFRGAQFALEDPGVPTVPRERQLPTIKEKISGFPSIGPSIRFGLRRTFEKTFLAPFLPEEKISANEELVRLAAEAQIARSEATVPAIALETLTKTVATPLDLMGKGIDFVIGRPLRRAVGRLPIEAKYKEAGQQAISMVANHVAYVMLLRGAHKAAPRVKAIPAIRAQRQAYKFLRAKEAVKIQKNNPGISRKGAEKLADILSGSKYGRTLIQEVQKIDRPTAERVMNTYYKEVGKNLRSVGAAAKGFARKIPIKKGAQIRLKSGAIGKVISVKDGLVRYKVGKKLLETGVGTVVEVLGDVKAKVMKRRRPELLPKVADVDLSRLAPVPTTDLNTDLIRQYKEGTKTLAEIKSFGVTKKDIRQFEKKAAPEPKVIKKRVLGARTLSGTVISKGGISTRSVGRDYNIKEDFREHGIAGVLKKDGLNIEKMAQELQAEGLLSPGVGESPADALVHALQGKGRIGADPTGVEVKEARARVREQKLEARREFTRRFTKLAGSLRKATSMQRVQTLDVVKRGIETDIPNYQKRLLQKLVNRYETPIKRFEAKTRQKIILSEPTTAIKIPEPLLKEGVKVPAEQLNRELTNIFQQIDVSDTIIRRVLREELPVFLEKYTRSRGISSTDAMLEIEGAISDPRLSTMVHGLFDEQKHIDPVVKALQPIKKDIASGDAKAIEDGVKKAVGEGLPVTGEPTITAAPEDKWSEMLKNELNLGDRLMNTYHASLGIEQRGGPPIATELYLPALKIVNFNNSLNQKYQTAIKDAVGDKYRQADAWDPEFTERAFIYLTNEKTNPDIAKLAWKGMDGEQRKVVRTIRRLFNEGFDKAQAAGIQLGFKEDYLSNVFRRLTTGKELPGKMDVPFKFERMMEQEGAGEGVQEKHPLLLLRRYWYIVSSYESGKIGWYNKAKSFTMPTKSLQDWHERRIADVMGMPIPGSIVWESKFRQYYPQLRKYLNTLTEGIPVVSRKMKRILGVWDKAFEKGQLVDQFTKDFANITSKTFLSWNPLSAWINETQKIHIIEQHGLNNFKKGVQFAQTPDFQKMWDKVIPIVKSSAAQWIPPGEETFGQKGMKWFRGADTRNRKHDIATAWVRFRDVWGEFKAGKISKERLLKSVKAGLKVDVKSLGLEYFHAPVQQSIAQKISDGNIWRIPENDKELSDAMNELVMTGTSDKFGAAFEYAWHAQGIHQFFYEPGSAMDVFAGPGGRIVGALSTWPSHRFGSLFNLGRQNPKRVWFVLLLAWLIPHTIYKMWGVDLRGKFGIGPLIRIPFGPAPQAALDLAELSREVYSGSSFGVRRQVFKLRRLPAPMPGGAILRRGARAIRRGEPLSIFPFRTKRGKGRGGGRSKVLRRRVLK